MNPVPVIAFADKSRTTIQILNALIRKGLAKEIYVIYGNMNEHSFAKDICDESSRNGVRCIVMDLESALDSLTMFNDVIVITKGKAIEVFGIAYNLGRAGTNVLIASYNPNNDKVSLVSARTLRLVAKL